MRVIVSPFWVIPDSIGCRLLTQPRREFADSPERWIAAIGEACSEPDPARAHRLITRLHYLLSEAMAEALRRDGGPNFHSWAVWGSRKAGVTIRQEDLDSAIRNAAITAGIVGGTVGAGAQIKERIRYVFALFRQFHGTPGVFSPPYSAADLESLVTFGNQ